MATREPQIFFKETRLNFEPTSSSYAVDVKLPSIATTSKNKRLANGSTKSHIDDDSLRTKNLATASAVYYRQHHQDPTNFLWRVLQDNTVLSLRTIDVCKQDGVFDANLILNFHFPFAIRPSCVALCDPPDHDALAVFVLDEAGQLYTLFLRPDSFRKRSFVESGLGDTCKIYVVNALQTFKIPYRLIAVNCDRLIVTLTDGGHIRLDKNNTHPTPQSSWRETFYNAKGWVQGFKSILSSRGEYDPTAATAAIESDLGLDNASFLFTVCLDHRLRIWNINNGQVIGAIDLLNAAREPNEIGKWRLDPTQMNLIRIMGRVQGKRLCVTYSPIGPGEFKFWKVESDDGSALDIIEQHPETHFIPTPPLGSDVWTLADFRVVEHYSTGDLQIWLLWKNNIAYRIQELTAPMSELPTRSNFNVVTSNVYQQMLGLLNETWSPRRPTEFPLTELGRSTITKIVTNICAPGSDIELLPHYIQCALLVRDRADLALELTPFSNQDPFSVYIQGRVSLALRDYPSAAMYFKKAAYGMSIPQADPGRHSSGLLDDEQWNLLFNGIPRYYAHIVALFEKCRAYSYSVDFARLSLQFINKKTKDADILRIEVQGRLFSGATAISQFELAHSTLIAMKDRALQHSFLRILIQKMCDNLHNAELVQLSFPGLQSAVDEVLAQKCQATVDVITGIPYHQILYSWRIKRNDYRGAAAILLDRIQKLRQLGEGDQFTSEDILDTVITRQYLMLINVLSCVEPKQAWITAEEPPPRPQAGAANGAPNGGKRKVVTLADIRKEYQDELDRIAAIQNNQFGFTADDEMEILYEG
ncbi:hypothetical protein ONZ43_g1765 [Nemania bipapillata]|uniref:Uncharacterized protein n=1 Tax=Nemania bipapillata TaxID=110536 RepID=A0ACC2J3D0_9PEZI|nr:hypothetical protein ONZ43_g1765 [Nemania bipapillata]